MLDPILMLFMMHLNPLFFVDYVTNVFDVSKAPGRTGKENLQYRGYG